MMRHLTAALLLSFVPVSAFAQWGPGPAPIPFVAGTTPTSSQYGASKGDVSTAIANLGLGHQALTYGSTLAPSMAAGRMASVTLTGNVILTCPSAMVAGGEYALRFIQDGTGSRIITWPACFTWPGGTVPTLSTGAGKIDILTFRSWNGITATAQLTLDYR